MPQNTNKELI